MHILFVMRHGGYVRNFEWALRQLGDRGHSVRLAFQAPTPIWMRHATDVPAQLTTKYANFSQVVLPLRTDGWGLLGQQLRTSLDYLRYLEPAYRDAPKLRRRAARDVPARVLSVSARGPLARRALGASLRTAHRSLPPSAHLDQFVQEQRPDVLLVTPLIEPGSPQTDIVRSARRHGVKTMVCVASWDNLTNKGLLHEPVDRVAVWNVQMKREAVELHGVDPARVDVTGAVPFDHWFDWQPSRDRRAFLGDVGLPAERPCLLYVCSSRFVAPNETGFVRRWVAALRSTQGPLQHASVLVRPHPQNFEQWQREDMLQGLESVRLFPATAAVPLDAPTRADYFDSIFHSAAVVGINTTAEIESAIVGRPVFTVLDPEFSETQWGTLHFHHLTHAGGGLVHLARSLEEHVAQLQHALSHPTTDDERSRRFVGEFVRPFGREVAATPRLVAAVEALGSAPAVAAVVDRSLAGRVLRPLLRPVASRLRQESSASAAAEARKSKEKRLKQQATARKRHLRDRNNAREIKRQAKALREPRPPVVVAPFAPQLPHKRVTLAQVSEGFRTLSASNRRDFIRQNVDFLPWELWFRMQNERAEQLDYAATDIRMRVTSKMERRRTRACAKEPFTVEWIERQVGAGQVLYDIGANVGAYSLIAAKKPSGGAHVVAFEPSVSNLASLCANVMLNELSEQVTPLGVALSNSNGLARFHMQEFEPGSAKHTLGNEPAGGPSRYSQPVMTYRLDDLIDLLQLPSPHHIKLDVDGGELAMLEGAARTLSSPLLETMLVEVSTDLSEPVTRLLEHKGLHSAWRINIRAKSGQFLVWYGLFARQPHTIPPPHLPSDSHSVIVSPQEV